MKQEELKHKAKEFFKEARSILLDRNKKYGDKNIKSRGLQGVIVRLSDKLARLEHLSENKDATDESIKDTCIDIANYAFLFYAEYLESANEVEDDLDEYMSESEKFDIILGLMIMLGVIDEDGFEELMAKVEKRANES